MVRMFTQRLSVPATGKIDDETKSIDMTLQQLVDQFNTLQGPSEPGLTCRPTQGHISGNELCRLVHSKERNAVHKCIRRRDGEDMTCPTLFALEAFLQGAL